jgi:hypothetical protein
MNILDIVKIHRAIDFGPVKLDSIKSKNFPIWVENSREA